jgi:hypothetical protein
MFTCRPLVIVAALALPAFACARGGAPASTPAEAPPPPIETDLAQGSRLVEPRVEELVRQMSARVRIPAPRPLTEPN